MEVVNTFGDVKKDLGDYIYKKSKASFQLRSYTLLIK